MDYTTLPADRVRHLSADESRRLTAACPIWGVRVVGFERDGKPFDVVKPTRAPSLDCAIGMVQLAATVRYGCTIDCIQAHLHQIASAWPRPNPETAARAGIRFPA